MFSLFSYPERTGASSALFAGLRISCLILVLSLMGFSVLSAQCTQLEDVHFRFQQGSSSGVDVGPNPATQNVYITAGGDETFVSFSIVDAEGNEVFSSAVQGYPVITVSLVGGQYTLYIETNQQTVVKQQQILCAT